MSSTTQMKSTQAIGKKPQLQLGSQGKAVLELEELLTKLGVYRQPAKGIFNKSVQFAVKLFQFRVFLPPDGIVGPLTWQVLDTENPVNMPILRFGSSGKAVANVQEVLSISKHYGGKIDGEFSTLTEKAVRAFQKSFGIEIDGIINQETWTALSQIPRGYDPKWFLTRAVSFSGKPGFCRGSAPVPTLPIHDLQAFQGLGLFPSEEPLQRMKQPWVLDIGLTR
ncbi:peptidoglycan-binding protein [Microcoleus sp. AR_TQ3_B6]|uniref:peptidoglycan-binding protein n=1 Tax=Microcoleus sp. AR_TQ3_B6 TaxID=3055284 RepID=UPI002FD4D4C8